MGRGSVVARERELEAISSFLDADPTHGHVLLLGGEAGIGKSSLWRAGTEMAAARGYRVLSAAAGQSETRISFTTLRDLFTGPFDDVAGELPTPQRRALAVVLMREDPVERPAEPATVSVAALSTLRLIASRTPVLLAIDDFQWVDAASADVVRFVTRRLDSAPVRALLTRRTSEAGESLDGIRSFDVGPCSLGALGRILSEHLARAYPRRTLQRVHSLSGGNPFYALEIALAIGTQDSGVGLGDPLPIPGSLLELVRDRLAALPPKTFDALAVASALSRPTLDSVGAAIGADVVGPLEAAIEAQIARTDGSHVWFVHPLFAAGVYELAAPRRREIHRRLAAVVGDPEERAQHLVRAGVRPGAEVARSIDEGAVAAAASGAPGTAAELAEAAARLTPPDAPADELGRLIQAADWHLDAGELEAARILLSPVTARTPPGPDRARLILRLAQTMDADEGIALLEGVLEDAGGDPKLLAEIQFQIAGVMLSTQGAAADLAAAVRATRLAELSGDRGLIASARGLQLLLEALVGIPVDPDVAASLSGEYVAHMGDQPPAIAASLWLMYRDRLDEAREVLEAVAAHAGARGDEPVTASAAFFLAELECRAGRYEAALERAAQAMAWEYMGSKQSLSAALYAAALARTYLGRVEEARAMSERGRALAQQVHDTIFDIQNEGVLGFLDLSLGDSRTAAHRLAPLWPRLVELGYGEPSVFPVLPNAIHALIDAGDRPGSERLLEQLEERGRALDSAWALSQAARLRALIASEDGEYDRALALIEEALVHHERMPGPFERGRTLLARGTILRRARHRRAARESLGQAFDVFEGLGTPLWSAKARVEMARIGGRAPSGDALTPSERRIAELVSLGHTNKEVAAILVVADRTVESALTQIYRKLDVRSRTELARWVSTQA